MLLKNWGIGAFFLLASSLAGPIWADVTLRAGQIVVIGEGRASAIPDQATLRLGARKTAKTARRALAATSEATEAILFRLDNAGISGGDIQTSSITLQPIWADYQDRQNDVQMPPIGFEASNQITARVRDLELLGVLLDEVTQDGANSFSGFTLGLQNRTPVQDDARRDAIADGQRKAQLYAEAAGLELGEILMITEDMNSAGGYPAPVMEMSMARGASVPVAQGEITLRASVKMVYAILP